MTGQQKRAAPYIGVTGFKTLEEIELARQHFTAALHSNIVPMYGFVTSSERIAHLTQAGTEAPAVADLATLVSATSPVSIPTLHYSPQDSEAMCDELGEALTTNDLYDRSLCQAVQLNMPWPNISDIENLCDFFPELLIIVPIDLTDSNDIHRVVERAGPYDDHVSYAVLDLSLELGKDVDLGYTTELAAALHTAMPTTRLVVAGGLSDENVASVVSHLTKVHPTAIGVDARGKLRSYDGKSIDPHKMGAYIIAAAGAYRR